MRVSRFAAAGLVVVATACMVPTGSHIIGISSDGGGSTLSSLSFTVQPGGAVAGSVITPAVQVTVLDSTGGPDLSFAGSVSVAIASNPSGGFLSGTLTQPVVSGVARFGDLSIDKAGNGYSLSASAFGTGGATSAAFSISPSSVLGSSARLP